MAQIKMTIHGGVEVCDVCCGMAFVVTGGDVVCKKCGTVDTTACIMDDHSGDRPQYNDGVPEGVSNMGAAFAVGKETPSTTFQGDRTMAILSHRVCNKGVDGSAATAEATVRVVFTALGSDGVSTEDAAGLYFHVRNKTTASFLAHHGVAVCAMMYIGRTCPDDMTVVAVALSTAKKVVPVKTLQKIHEALKFTVMSDPALCEMFATLFQPRPTLHLIVGALNRLGVVDGRWGVRALVADAFQMGEDLRLFGGSDVEIILRSFVFIAALLHSALPDGASTTRRAPNGAASEPRPAPEYVSSTKYNDHKGLWMSVAEKWPGGGIDAFRRRVKHTASMVQHGTTRRASRTSDGGCGYEMRPGGAGRPGARIQRMRDVRASVLALIDRLGEYRPIRGTAFASGVVHVCVMAMEANAELRLKVEGRRDGVVRLLQAASSAVRGVEDPYGADDELVASMSATKGLRGLVHCARSFRASRSLGNDIGMMPAHLRNWHKRASRVNAT